MTALPTPGRVQPDCRGSRIDAVSLRQAVARCTSAIDAGEYLCVGMVNAAKVVAMRKDAPLRSPCSAAAWCLPTARPWSGHRPCSAAPLPERVTGIDLFTELLARASRRGDRVYLPRRDRRRPARRASPRSGAGIRAWSSRARGTATSVREQEQEVAEAIRRPDADLLFLGMSSPRKELFGAHFGEATGAKVIHGVGGSFDILAGITRRAPRWWQRHGLEWLYRAVQEPVRLGRRYLTTNVAFIALVARAVVGRAGTGGAAR